MIVRGIATFSNSFYFDGKDKFSIYGEINVPEKS